MTNRPNNDIFNPVITQKRLRLSRKNAGLTQEEAAKVTGLSYAMVRKYETGESPHKPGPLAELASAYNVSFAYLMGIDDAPQLDIKSQLGVPKSAQMYTIASDDLAPYLYTGDVVFVDPAQTDIRKQGIYALTDISGEYIYRRSTGAELLSGESSQAAAIKIKPENLDKIPVAGCIVKRCTDRLI